MPVDAGWVPAHRLDVDAVKQPVQLFGGQLDHYLRLPGPDETVGLEPFHHQPEARAIVQQQLDPVAAAIMEGEHGAGKRIELHGLLDQRHQAVHASPEVDRRAVQVDPRVGVKPEHQCAPRAAIIAVTSAASCPVHSNSTVTPLGRRADSRDGDTEECTGACRCCV